jgi:hypothetical protein
MIVAICTILIPLKLISQPALDYSDSGAFYAAGQEVFGQLLAGTNDLQQDGSSTSAFFAGMFAQELTSFEDEDI